MKDTKEEKEWEKREDELWELLKEQQGRVFWTAKNLEYTYEIKGNEMFVSRKDKSITRASVNLAYRKAEELQQDGGTVAGPKKLGCFGASYLYPVFIEIGIIKGK